MIREDKNFEDLPLTEAERLAELELRAKKTSVAKAGS